MFSEEVPRLDAAQQLEWDQVSWKRPVHRDTGIPSRGLTWSETHSLKSVGEPEKPIMRLKAWIPSHRPKTQVSGDSQKRSRSNHYVSNFDSDFDPFFLRNQSLFIVEMTLILLKQTSQLFVNDSVA